MGVGGGDDGRSRSSRGVLVLFTCVVGRRMCGGPCLSSDEVTYRTRKMVADVGRTLRTLCPRRGTSGVATGVLTRPVNSGRRVSVTRVPD